MTSLKVAIASSGVTHVKRGIETWAVDLTHALLNRDVDACLFQGSGVEDGNRVTVPCLYRGHSHNEWLTRTAPGWFWRLRLKSSYDIEQTTFAFRLLCSRQISKYDLLHTQDPHIAYVLDRCHRLGIFRPKVLLAHGTEETPDLLSRLSNVQHLAPQHAEEIAAYKKPASNWFVGPNFVDTQRFHPGSNAKLREELGIPVGALTLVTSAAIKKHHKRIDYLVDEFCSFANQCSDQPHLIIAGASTEDSNELMADAKRRAPNSIHFLRDQPHELMPEILRAGDLFVLCSLKEMMPIALLEAIASGLPALVSTHPVVNWMTGPGGQAVEMEKSGALSGALCSWTDSDKRNIAGSDAREHALNHFSEDRVVNDLIEIYRELIV